MNKKFYYGRRYDRFDSSVIKGTLNVDKLNKLLKMSSEEFEDEYENNLTSTVHDLACELRYDAATSLKNRTSVAGEEIGVGIGTSLKAAKLKFLKLQEQLEGY